MKTASGPGFASCESTEELTNGIDDVSGLEVTRFLPVDAEDLNSILHDTLKVGRDIMWGGRIGARKYEGTQ